MDIYEILLTAFFNGMAFTVAVYIANRLLIRNLEKIEKKLNKKK